MKEHVSVVTRKGQITIPVALRRSLGLEVGDKVALLLGEEAQESIILRPVRSVAEMTFGAVPPRRQPEDFAELRREFEEGVVDSATARLTPDGEP
jgi:AbrB family looped-hinge helix DNA binding protein